MFEEECRSDWIALQTDLILLAPKPQKVNG